MNNEIILKCPTCYKEFNVYHLDWYHIACLECGKIKSRNEFYVKIKDYEILYKKLKESQEI